jgi:hypothetical protein
LRVVITPPKIDGGRVRAPQYPPVRGKGPPMNRQGEGCHLPIVDPIKNFAA